MSQEKVYAQDGVDSAEGNSFSAMAGAACRRTFENSPFVEVRDFSDGHFRGPRGFRFKNLSWDYLDGAPDGIGTKVVIIDAAFFHEEASRDLFAMTGGDVTRWGGNPLLFFNVLDVSALGEEGTDVNIAYRSMMRGMERVAKEQNIVCFRGETASLGACVGSENPEALTRFNWAGFMLGAYREDRMITGDTLAPGQVVVALREYGFRSNGLSSVSKAFQRKFGACWWNNPDAKIAITQAARRSTLYDRFLAAANGWTVPLSEPKFNFHLVTHVTGDGIVGKFAEDMLFPRGFTARLDNLFNPPSIMQQIALWRDIPEQECYEMFNCGNGVLVVLDQEEVSRFIEMAAVYDIEARACGIITDKSAAPMLTIHSGFSGNMLEYRSKPKQKG